MTAKAEEVHRQIREIAKSQGVLDKSIDPLQGEILEDRLSEYADYAKSELKAEPESINQALAGIGFPYRIRHIISFKVVTVESCM